ncbi:MAG: metal-dependent hydrolase [Gemmatimonadales bacterium]|nr:metal-dependent hydrolase [Gemmatimonadales bacterium]
MHWLPNADSLVVKAGLAKPEFHCTVTHTFLFAVLVSAFVALFSPHYAIFAFVAIVAHFAADIGSTVGLPLFWPVYKKRLTLALFKDTGFWGWDMYIGYYKQPMAWILEGAVIAFFVYRLFVIGVL